MSKSRHKDTVPEIRICSSIGISVYPEDGVDTEILLKKADDAMYQVKNSGKNSYRLSSH